MKNEKNGIIVVLCVLSFGLMVLLYAQTMNMRAWKELALLHQRGMERTKLLEEQQREIADLVLDNSVPAHHDMIMVGLKGMLRQIYDQYREIGDLRKEVRDLRRQLEDGPLSATDNVENVAGPGGGGGFG